VQPDIYTEHIFFSGKNITVASLFLLTGDTSYISSTIIDGSSSGTVVRFVNDETADAILTGFTIQNGVGSFMRGGGIKCEGSSPTVSHNIISGNTADLSGGGIYCYDSSPNLYSNTITNNTASIGGGIRCDNSNATVSYNIISGNTCATGYGGGIYFNNSSADLNNNTITNNSALHGGGICCWGSAANITHNMISGNSADDKGVGLYSTGSIPDLSFNVFYDNSAVNGAGIYFVESQVQFVTNNVIYQNTASEYGGGISSFSTNNVLTVVNTIVWGNSAVTDGNQIYWDMNLPTVNYSDIEGGWGGNGNIDCDPMFCDPDNGDFYLDAISCCVGAGEGGGDIGAYGIGCTSGYTPIYDIQINNTDIGAEGCYPSPMEGANVTTAGIVTNWRKEAGDNQQALFFIQDPVDNVWEGLFIYDYPFTLDPPISIGDSVSVQGEVYEFDGLTCIVSLVDVTILSSGHSRPTPLDMTVADFAVECDSVAEKYEDVLVRLFDIEILSSIGNNWWLTDPSTPDSIELSTVLFRADPACVDNPPSTGVFYESVTGNIIWDSEELTWMITPGCLDFESSSGYSYLPGDVNMSAGTWPPSATGPDVTYLVNFFRGAPTSHSCRLDGFWCSADANGDCKIIGSDVTKLVNVFRGIGSIGYCTDYEPAWPTPVDLPAEAPDGWPGCEAAISGRVIPSESSGK